MKTLKEHTLVYDEDCPLCKAYTGSFIRHEWLDSNGRASYQQLSDVLANKVDMERAQSEVALIDKQGNKVHYGIDAMMLIFGYRMPLLQPLFKQQWFRWLMQKLYSFISYNRKVIAATVPFAGATRNCTPAYNLKYRLLYLLLACLLTAVTLHTYSPLVASIVGQTTFIRELLIAGGQIFFQGVVLCFIAKGNVMNYLGNMMTVSLIGSMLLLPVIVLAAFFPTIHPMFFTAYFMLVAGVMLLEHFRRMRILKLGYIPSTTWVLYRLIVLALLLA